MTVLLCIHDVVKLCYDMWSWEDRLRRSEELRMSNQSREYTSEIMKDTSRRIMQRTHSVEKLECFEVLIEIRQNGGVDVPLIMLILGQRHVRVSIWFAEDTQWI